MTNCCSKAMLWTKFGADLAQQLYLKNATVLYVKFSLPFVPI